MLRYSILLHSPTKAAQMSLVIQATETTTSPHDTYISCTAAMAMPACLRCLNHTCVRKHRWNWLCHICAEQPARLRLKGWILGHGQLVTCTNKPSFIPASCTSMQTRNKPVDSSCPIALTQSSALFMRNMLSNKNTCSCFHVLAHLACMIAAAITSQHAQIHPIQTMTE